MSMASFMSSVSPVALTQPKMKSKIELDSGHVLYVAEGDLTEYKVDAIVNAANEALEHVGGIAKAIVDKGILPFTVVISISYQCITSLE